MANKLIEMGALVIATPLAVTFAWFAVDYQTAAFTFLAGIFA